MPKCFSRYSVSLFISQTASDLLWFALPDGFPLPWRFFFSFLHFAHENTLSQQVPKFVMCEKKKQKNRTHLLFSPICQALYATTIADPSKRGKTGNISLLFWGVSPSPMGGQESYRRDCSIEDSNCRAWSALSLSGGIVTSAPSII